MKKCSLCKTEKPFSEFNRKGEGYQGKCRPCQKEWYTNYYQNSGREKARLTQQRVKNRAEIREYIKETKSVSCADCGVQYPSYVMDFDHLGDKEFNIGRSIGSVTIRQIKQEIAKCEVVCSNCHRQRTFDRSQGTMYDS